MRLAVPGLELMIPPQPTALITGAAGTLGRALVEHFVGSGWKVSAGWHRNPPHLSAPSAVSVRIDVTRLNTIQAAVQETVQTWGRLDVIVHAAGVAPKNLLVHEPIESWDETVKVHLTAALFCFQASYDTFRNRNGGQLIFIGSHAGFQGTVGQISYSTAKAGLHGLTGELARMGGPENIRVNLVLPGVMESPMLQGVSDRTRKEWIRANSLGRLNDPGEVARFIVLLAEMQNVSGQVFQLDSRF